MNEIIDIYEKHPFLGYRKIHVYLKKAGFNHNIKKTQRIMQYAGIKAIYPEKKTTFANKQSHIYPYLLKNIKIEKPNQVWQTDITYIKIKTGYAYLTCIIDVFSRKIMGWNLSPFLDVESCIVAFDMSVKNGIPEILNTDQGSQFTSNIWIEKVTSFSIKISMDGKGRWADNIYIERLWRTIKYESVYLNSFESLTEARNVIEKYIEFYNTERVHQALKYKTPCYIYQKFIGTLNGDINLTNKTYDNIKEKNSQVDARFVS